MTYESFTIEVDADGIALLTIDVPGQTMNVWNETMIADFARYVDSFVADDSVKGLVIASGKANSFIAGADLRMLEKSATPLTAEGFEQGMNLSRIFRKLENGGHSAQAIAKEGKTAKPVACAIEGLALGGGLELTLACHYRVVADNSAIQLGLPEVNVGLLPGAGGTQRSLRLIGIQNAAVLTTQGKPLNPETAKAQGLVHELTEIGGTVAAAKKWVRANPSVLAPWDKKGFKIPGGSGMLNPDIGGFFAAANGMALAQTRNNYPAVQAILSCLYEGSILPIDKALGIEVKYFMRLHADPVSRNMIRSLFISKQALEKGSARPEGVPTIDIKTVGVLGAGLMGAGIAHVTAKAGMDVIVLDRTDEEAQKAIAYTRKILDGAVAKGRMTQDKADAFLSRIKVTSDYNDLAAVDLVIEAVFERPDVKAEVTRATEAVIGKNVVFASNTSTIPIGDLAKASERPELFLGMHFFSPVDKMPLLEIIPHAGTSEYAIAAAFDYNRKVRKTPIVVADVRGFYTNQVFPSYINEALALIVEGVSPALIENAARNLGMPIGPLALQDEFSFHLGLDVMNTTKQELGDKYVAQKSDGFYEVMVNEVKRMGRRDGAGLYDYAPDGKRLGLWKGLSEYYPLADPQPRAEEVIERLLYSQLVPATRCFTDGVIKDAQSADVGAILGWGFPAWTGGPLAHIDTLGIDEFVSTSKRLESEHGNRFALPAELATWPAEGKLFYV